LKVKERKGVEERKNFRIGEQRRDAEGAGQKNMRAKRWREGGEETVRHTQG
jgi:hypothetical protein